jgi:16S rRNA (guanine966-N2)-methyltransferase
MRVIAGTFRGRRLKAVPGMNTRPTTDKVKESMFNIIGPYFDGGTALDLFAGTGGLGIEALSRGIDRAFFIDKDYKALQTVRDNLASLGLTKERAEVHKNDAKRALDALKARELKFDLVFLDPPYKLTGLYEELILRLQQKGLLQEGAVIVAEHAADVELPDRFAKAVRWRLATYGEIAISFYEWKSEMAEANEEGMTE